MWVRPSRSTQTPQARAPEGVLPKRSTWESVSLSVSKEYLWGRKQCCSPGPGAGIEVMDTQQPSSRSHSTNTAAPGMSRQGAGGWNV